MQLAAYFHGPAVIDPWLRYLQNHPNRIDLNSPEGRTEAVIDLFVRVQQLPNDEKTCLSLVTKSHFGRERGVRFMKSVSAKSAYAESTAILTREVRLPTPQLMPLAYAPERFAAKYRKEVTKIREDAQAA